MYKVGDDNLLRNDNGGLIGPLVNSFAVGEMVFPGISLICCRLWDGAKGQESGVDDGNALQFRMTSESARQLAKLLLAKADEVEGVGKAHQ